LGWISSQVHGVKFQQSPPHIVKQGSGAKIECSHDDSSLIMMLWYQQRTAGSPLTLIAYGYENLPSYEDDFKREFTLTRNSPVNGALVISRAKQSHSAVYFCAASTQYSGYEAYFGPGTKLTVL
uniref:Ig-like domain-containing protein n=1 Tax=Tetraodon nigroviridis TaxID=99883 RepID=H3C3I1_TETNG